MTEVQLDLIRVTEIFCRTLILQSKIKHSCPNNNPHSLLIKAPQPADGLILTKAGNLSDIKHIIHMVGQTNEKGISSSMYKVLRMCEENKIQSVSFPALGTGKSVHSEIQMSKAKQRYLDDPKLLNVLQEQET